MIKINRNGGFRHNLAVHQKRLTDRIQRTRELSMGLGEPAGWLGLGRVEISAVWWAMLHRGSQLACCKNKAFCLFGQSRSC